METGSHMTAHTTIQSRQTAVFRAAQKQAVCVGISAGIVPLRRSLVKLVLSRPDFSLPSLHPKIPFPAAGLRRPISLGRPGRSGIWGEKTPFETVRNYCGFNPSAPNCWSHSVGASRNRSTPMPRGNRPSTAALTRSGARKASEMVMLTWRTLHFWRAAIC
jgi:hypothetical protein